VTREDRLFHAISLAWAAIIGLLATQQPSARTLAYEAFADLDRAEQEQLLTYLGERRIEEAHPPPLWPDPLGVT
jgi:hypothetical protein